MNVDLKLGDILAPMAQRKRRKSKPPSSKRRVSSPAPQNSLLFKVVELSTVDEWAIEQCLNEWSRRGWRFDGMQFAMRESSRRPSMAFVVFTREAKGAFAHPDDLSRPLRAGEHGPNPDEARARLVRLAEAPERPEDP